ncbi:MAG: hypothetical protein ACXAEF_02725 [Candidatus Thorarchaeota archaeon]|jgi:rRNA maturation protein Rpf1
MSVNELVSKISIENAKIALVISTFRGNPGNIQFLSKDGSIQYEIRIESAVLRREVASDVRNKIDNLSMIALLQSSSEKLKQFSRFLASLLSIPLTDFESIEEIHNGNSNQAYILLRESGKKIHWSWHHAKDQKELGPRIRITQLRSIPDE